MRGLNRMTRSLGFLTLLLSLTSAFADAIIQNMGR